MKNEVTVRIFNRSLSLKTEETAEYTDKLASGLNKKLKDILKAAPSLSSIDAAAIICLECYDELVKARKNIENIRSQIKGYVDDAAIAKAQLDETDIEVNQLRKRVAQLEREVALRKDLSISSEKASAMDIISKDINDALENKYPYNYKK